MGVINEEGLYSFVNKIPDITLPDRTTVCRLADLFPDLRETVSLLVRFLETPEHDPRLERLTADFHQHMEIILQEDLKEYPGAIDGLAQRFESFLKKIGL